MRKWPVLEKHNLHHHPQKRKNYRCHTQQTLLKSVSLTGNGGCVSPVDPGDLCVRYSFLQLRTLLVCAREGELPSPASSRTLRTFHLTGTSSLPAAGGQGGTELFRARAAFSQHLSTGTDRLHSLFAPSCSSFSGSCYCQTASHGKERTQILGFRTYSHSRSRRRRLQNVHHHQHSSH